MRDKNTTHLQSFSLGLLLLHREPEAVEDEGIARHTQPEQKGHSFDLEAGARSSVSTLDLPNAGRGRRKRSSTVAMRLLLLTSALALLLVLVRVVAAAAVTAAAAAAVSGRPDARPKAVDKGTAAARLLLLLLVSVPQMLLLLLLLSLFQLKGLHCNLRA